MSKSAGLRTAVICGLLWGFGVTLAATLAEPISGLTVGQWLYFTMSLLWSWTLVGLVWTVGAQMLAQGRWAGAKLVLLLPPALAVGVVAQWISPFPTARSHDEITTPLVGPYPLFDLAMYMLWQNIFFGGLYVTGYLATRRITRASQRLAEFQLARNEADFQVREAQVSAFRGQLQPSLLLTAIAELRKRYIDDPARGDALFDSLIAFLRVAMPSVRSGISTLDAELETIRNYASLRRMLTVAGPQWDLELPAVLPPLPFPSLILLPAMHSLGATLCEHDLLTLQVTVSQDLVVLRLNAGRAIRLSDQIDRRLRGGLRLTFGPAAWVSEGSNLPIIIHLFPQRIGTGISENLMENVQGGSDETQDNDGDRRARIFFADPK